LFWGPETATLDGSRSEMEAAMTDDEIYQKLTSIFREVFDDDSIVPAALMTAQDIAGWDSLANIRMIVAVEEALGIRFSTAEITSHQNVGDFVVSIHSKL
jgi:acyl carrier protein